MGSSKKHKDRGKERERKKRRRSRSRSPKERKHGDGRSGKSSHKRRKGHGGHADAETDKNVEVINLDVDEEPFEVKGSGESLNVSDTNKLRAKLGLKPLQTGSEIPGLGEEVAQGENGEEKEEVKEVFVRTENMQKKKAEEMLREKLQVNKQRRKIVEKLKHVKALGESESDDESASKWVDKSRKIQEEKNQAAKRAKLLEEMDAEFGVAALVEEEFQKKKAYGMKDLKGLSVGHSIDSIKEGQMIILTLKDQAVLETSDDVLINVNIVDDERANKNVENMKNKPAYEPYEEPEYDEFGILQKKNLLSKYDEELTGPKKEAFKIGKTIMDKGKELELIRSKLKQQQGESLQMPPPRLANEYLTQEEMVQFKKPKKKRKVMRKRSGLKPDDIMPLPGQKQTATDHGSRSKKKAGFVTVESTEAVFKTETRNTDQAMEENEIMGPDEDLTGVSIEDDKAELELENALHKTRRLKLRISNNDSFEKMARSVSVKREPAEDEEDLPEAKDLKDKGGLNIILNSVAEFCRTLGDIPTYGLSGNREEEAEELANEFDQEMAGDDWQPQEMEENRGSWNQIEVEEPPPEIPNARENEPILEEEPDVSTGLAGALHLAMKKGYLDNDNEILNGSEKPSALQAQSFTIEEKFYEDDKFGRRDRYTGPIQDFREKETYKPDVKLEYIDDNGRLLNEKEAFRYLSHKFHGKGPGKNKVDKRTKKLDQEGKLKQMSSTDTPLNTLKLLQEKQRDLHTPYILLSGGSKALTQTSITKSK